MVKRSYFFETEEVFFFVGSHMNAWKLSGSDLIDLTSQASEEAVSCGWPGLLFCNCVHHSLSGQQASHPSNGAMPPPQMRSIPLINGTLCCLCNIDDGHFDLLFFFLFFLLPLLVRF